MSQEKSVGGSPFAAMTYQEQQDRWLEWRSRQLDYQPAEREPEAEVAAFPETQREEPLPPLTLPFVRQAAPTRHRELDRVLARHTQAAKRAGNFQPTSRNEPGQ